MKTFDYLFTKMNFIFSLFFIFISIFIFESCAFTWIGRSAGGDIGRPNFNDPSNNRVTKVPFEKVNFGGRNQVEIHKTDSSIVTGRFLGYKPFSVSNNDISDNNVVNTIFPGSDFLYIGDVLVIRKINSNRTLEGIFEGFEENKILIKNRNKVLSIPVQKIFNVSNNGEEIDLVAITRLSGLSLIADRIGVLISNNLNQEIIIPCEEIAYALCQKGERNGKLIGTFIGIIIDAAIIVIKSRDEVTDMTSMLNF